MHYFGTINSNFVLLKKFTKELLREKLISHISRSLASKQTPGTDCSDNLYRICSYVLQFRGNKAHRSASTASQGLKFKLNMFCRLVPSPYYLNSLLTWCPNIHITLHPRDEFLDNRWWSHGNAGFQDWYSFSRGIMTHGILIRYTASSYLKKKKIYTLTLPYNLAYNSLQSSRYYFKHGIKIAHLYVLEIHSQWKVFLSHAQTTFYFK